jgi:transcriptional regulator with XRE-family HTH domain
MAPGQNIKPRALAAEWLAELCAARLTGGYPREKIAAALDIKVETLISWENKRRIPSLINLVGFGRELGLRLVVTGRDGRTRPGRAAVKPDEPWTHREIRKLGAALRSERRAKALTQDAVAAAADVSKRSMVQFESGQMHPRPAVLAAWATALDCRVRWKTMV